MFYFISSILRERKNREIFLIVVYLSVPDYFGICYKYLTIIDYSYDEDSHVLIIKITPALIKRDC